MSCLDFRLQHLQKNLPGETRVHILLQYRSDLSTIEGLGFRTTSVAGDVAAGSILLCHLKALEEHPDVILVESSRRLKEETDVSSVAINLLDPHTNLSTIPGKGSGAIVGVIDSGFDLTHPCFLNSQKKTRIMVAWDQVNYHNFPGTAPSQFGYGIEYTQDDINQCVAAKRILIVENDDEAAAHGTYVAGIAAGNGAPQGVYRGMAPQADLILVTFNNKMAIGGSAFVLDAIDYIQAKARACGRPVVINLSQGDNLGAHDGTGLLEKAIDYLVGKGRLLVVKSAGNGRQQPSLHHAQGEVESNRDFVLPFSLAPGASNQIDGDTIELWYRRGDRFSVAIRSTGGWTSPFVISGTSQDITFPAGNRAHVYSEMNHPTNGDNHIGVILEKGEGWAGTWTLILRGDEVRRGDFDAWSDRQDGVTLIDFEAYQSDASTITLPGTARRIITVGGFVSRPVQRGETGDVTGGISLGSSIGPTRDGRVKPDLTAPSSLIMAPRRRIGKDPHCYDLQRGTSMSAPHVTGVIALLWAQWPDLTSGEIRAALYSTAKTDVFTGATPNTSWGYGKLDAGAAYEALSIQPRNGEKKMADTHTVEMRLDLLKEDGTEHSVTVEFAVSGQRVVKTAARDARGEKYDISFVVSKASGGECYVCLDEPCPPNRLVQVNPCPVGEVKKKMKGK